MVKAFTVFSPPQGFTVFSDFAEGKVNPYLGGNLVNCDRINPITLEIVIGLILSLFNCDRFM